MEPLSLDSVQDHVDVYLDSGENTLNFFVSDTAVTVDNKYETPPSDSNNNSPSPARGDNTNVFPFAAPGTSTNISTADAAATFAAAIVSRADLSCPPTRKRFKTAVTRDSVVKARSIQKTLSGLNAMSAKLFIEELAKKVMTNPELCMVLEDCIPRACPFCMAPVSPLEGAMENHLFVCDNVVSSSQ